MDLIIVNGNVITVDNSLSIVQAVAVNDGKIEAVGTIDQIKALADPHTKTLDLKGKTMLPGIHDSHIHATLFWGSKPPLVLDVSCPPMKSVRDILKVVAKKVEITKPGEWIRGTGLDLDNLEECKRNPQKYPTRWDLDLASPENPVYLGVIPFSIREHINWLNTKALELVGISKDTPVPPGCDIVKDPTTGEPTGVLKGGLLTELVTRAIPCYTMEQKKTAILTAMAELNSLGITSITEGALGPGGMGFQGGLWDEECIEAYKDLYMEGKLTLRVSILLLLTPYGSFDSKSLYEKLPRLKVDSGFDNNQLKIGGIKLFADGIPLSKTAWMYDEYIGGDNGTMIFPGNDDEERCDELMNIVSCSHKLGLRIGIHVTGDRSINACINSFVKNEQKEPKDLRHYLIHGDFISLEDVKLMAEYNIGVSVQPTLINLVNNFLPSLVGKERAAKHGCLATLIHNGVHVSAGSDAPVTYPDWKQAIQLAVLRESDPQSEIAEHINVNEAIRMYTIDGAWQDRTDNVKGSIEVGKLADFCIIDEDILAIDPHRIKDIITLMTIVGGEIVYDAGLIE